MRARRTVMIAIFAMACLGPTVPPQGKYTLSGTVVGGSQIGADACVFGSWIPIAGSLTQPWEGRVTLGFGRLMKRNGRVIKRDTNFVGHWIRISPQGPDSVLLSLVGPITIDLRAARTDPTSFTGAWLCDTRFPFADDSSRPNPGLWGLLTY